MRWRHLQRQCIPSFDVFSGATYLFGMSVASFRLGGDDTMARKTPKGKSASFMMFNVIYEDGMVTSNRKISTELLDQSFGDSIQDLALAAISEQDNEIARLSSQRRAKIKTISIV
jgi:hypothetical protein